MHQLRARLAVSSQRQAEAMGKQRQGRSEDAKHADEIRIRLEQEISDLRQELTEEKEARSEAEEEASRLLMKVEEIKQTNLTLVEAHRRGEAAAVESERRSHSTEVELASVTRSLSSAQADADRHKQQLRTMTSRIRNMVPQAEYARVLRRMRDKEGELKALRVEYDELRSEHRRFVNAIQDRSAREGPAGAESVAVEIQNRWLNRLAEMLGVRLGGKHGKAGGSVRPSDQHQQSTSGLSDVVGLEPSSPFSSSPSDAEAQSPFASLSPGEGGFHQRPFGGMEGGMPASSRPTIDFATMSRLMKGIESIKRQLSLA